MVSFWGFFSGINLILGHTEVYFDALAMLCLAQTAARYLEITRAQASAASLLAQPSPGPEQVMAPRIAKGWIEVKALKPGDEFQLTQGDVLPVDAYLKEHSAHFDLSVVSGESEPQSLGTDTLVPAGAQLSGTSAHFQAASAYGEASRDIQLLKAMMEMCEKPRLQNRLDNWASLWLKALLVVFLVQLSLLLFKGQGLTENLRQLTSVILLGCPCALSLAGIIPLHRLSLIWQDANIRLRSLASIESCAMVDTVVFDKTGTLTTLQLTPESIQTLQQWSPEDRGLLKVAARLSRHPVSESLNTLLTEQALPEPALRQCINYPGKGIAIELADRVPRHLLRFGSSAWLASEGVTVIKPTGSSVVLALGTRLIGVLDFIQTRQENLIPLLMQLKNRDLALILCSGDSQQAVKTFCKDLDGVFTAVYADYKPEQKRQLVQDLKQQGHCVAMVGDGINDVASSSAANLGIGFQHTAGTGLHQDLQLSTVQQLSRLADLLGQARFTLSISRISLFAPVITTVALLALNTVTTIPPLLVAFSMFSNIVLIYLLAGLIKHPEKRQPIHPESLKGISLLDSFIKCI